MKNINFILLTISILFLSACGGGGGPGQSAGSVINGAIVLQGSAATTVKGIELTISIPAGVSLRADAMGELLSGVITLAAGVPSGTQVGKYLPAANGVLATVTLAYATAGNLTAGDILLVNADLSASATIPTAAGFTIIKSKLTDADGVPISTSGATVSLRLQ